MSSVQSVAAAAATEKRVRAEARSRLMAEVRAAHEAGVPIAAIARAAGVTRPTAHRWVRDGSDLVFIA